MDYLITGGCGFIGCNFIRLLLRDDPEANVTNVDKLTYAGRRENLSDVEADFSFRYRFVKADIADREAMRHLFAEADFDCVINFAAESHVDKSIVSPDDFVQTNIVGTSILVELARANRVPRFVQISTDEVYGELGDDGFFTEETPLQPSSPYSASKASADLLVHAAHRTYGQHVVITRCSNNYGPYQFPEKLIPVIITRAMEGLAIPVYGEGKNVRDWIHVDDHCRGILAAMREGQPGEVYNFGSENEWHNIDLVTKILAMLGKPESLIEYVTDRPGHDARYAIDAAKAQSELGWAPTVDFDEGLQQTIDWYAEHHVG